MAANFRLPHFGQGGAAATVRGSLLGIAEPPNNRHQSDAEEKEPGSLRRAVVLLSPQHEKNDPGQDGPHKREMKAAHYRLSRTIERQQRQKVEDRRHYAATFGRLPPSLRAM